MVDAGHPSGRPTPHPADRPESRRWAVQQTVEFLSKVDLFKEVKGDALERLAGQIRLVSLSEGELFFREDEPTDGLYCRPSAIMGHI